DVLDHMTGQDQVERAGLEVPFLLETADHHTMPPPAGGLGRSLVEVDAVGLDAVPFGARLVPVEQASVRTAHVEHSDLPVAHAEAAEHSSQPALVHHPLESLAEPLAAVVPVCDEVVGVVIRRIDHPKFGDVGTRVEASQAALRAADYGEPFVGGVVVLVLVANPQNLAVLPPALGARNVDDLQGAARALYRGSLVQQTQGRALACRA